MLKTHRESRDRRALLGATKKIATSVQESSLGRAYQMPVYDYLYSLRLPSPPLLPDGFFYREGEKKSIQEMFDCEHSIARIVHGGTGQGKSTLFLKAFYDMQSTKLDPLSPKWRRVIYAPLKGQVPGKRSLEQLVASLAIPSYPQGTIISNA